ncbi:MAG: hypothetical protein ABSG43_19765 [Solirubrobacteraceae bacterium]
MRVGGVLDVEQIGDLAVVVLGPEQLWDVLWSESWVEVDGAVVRAG